MVPLLLHVPPAGVLFSVVIEPAQTVSAPPIAAGKGFTVTLTGSVVPHAVAYVTETVDVVVTDGIPVTTPEVFTLPIAGALLVHVPPNGVLLNVVCKPAQTASVPEIAVGPETKAREA